MRATWFNLSKEGVTRVREEMSVLSGLSYVDPITSLLLSVDLDTVVAKQTPVAKH